MKIIESSLQFGYSYMKLIHENVISAIGKTVKYIHDWDTYKINATEVAKRKIKNKIDDITYKYYDKSDEEKEKEKKSYYLQQR